MSKVTHMEQFAHFWNPEVNYHLKLISWSKKYSCNNYHIQQRLNVMLTRATSLLIVIGCSQTLATNPTWCNFINYVKANGGFRTGSEVPMWREDQTVGIPFKSYQQVLVENQRSFNMTDMDRQFNNVVQSPTNYHGNVNRQFMGPKYGYPQSPTHVHQSSVHSPGFQRNNRLPPEKDPNKAFTQRSFATQHLVRMKTELEAESNQPENDYVRNSENSLTFSALDCVRNVLSSPLSEVPEVEIRKSNLPGAQEVATMEDHGAVRTPYSKV